MGRTLHESWQEPLPLPGDFETKTDTGDTQDNTYIPKHRAETIEEDDNSPTSSDAYGETSGEGTPNKH